jgi:integrase
MLTYQIQPLDVLELIQGRVEGYAPTRDGSRCHDQVSLKRALNEVNVLSQTFRDMLIASCAIHNPVTAARIYARSVWHHDPRKRPALNPREFAGLVDCTDEDHQAMMDLLGTHGPRLGEVLALPIRNYDPDGGLITIDCSWSRGQVGPTKTDSSRRTIRVSEEVNRRLRRALERALRVPNREQVLFPGPAGGYTDPSHWRESVFHPAVTRAVAHGLISDEIAAVLVPHALRHTAAHNMLLHQGKEMTQVMAILGHASINITVSLYGHVKPITG